MHVCLACILVLLSQCAAHTNHTAPVPCGWKKSAGSPTPTHKSAGSPIRRRLTIYLRMPAHRAAIVPLAALHQHQRGKEKLTIYEYEAHCIMTFEWLRIVPPLRHWLRHIQIRMLHVWESVRWRMWMHPGAVPSQN